MRVCILGSGLTALTLAKALVNQSIDVDVLVNRNRGLCFMECTSRPFCPTHRRTYHQKD